MFKKEKEEKQEEKKQMTLDDVAGLVESLEKRIAVLSEEMSALKESEKFHVQRTGMIRFNPFSGIGGDQSFSLALLNANHDGVVITNIYSLEGSRVFAKSIEKGGSKHVLSEEEKEAIKIAISN